MKQRKQLYKTWEGAHKRCQFENAIAEGEFKRGDKAEHYKYVIVAGENGTYRVNREDKV